MIFVEIDGQTTPEVGDKVFAGGAIRTVESVTLRDTEDGGGDHGQWRVATDNGVLMLVRHMEWTKVEDDQ